MYNHVLVSVLLGGLVLLIPYGAQGTECAPDDPFPIPIGSISTEGSENAEPGSIKPDAAVAESMSRYCCLVAATDCGPRCVHCESIVPPFWPPEGCPPEWVDPKACPVGPYPCRGEDVLLLPEEGAPADDSCPRMGGLPLHFVFQVDLVSEGFPIVAWDTEDTGLAEYFGPAWEADAPTVIWLPATEGVTPDGVGTIAHPDVSPHSDGPGKSPEEAEVNDDDHVDEDDVCCQVCRCDPFPPTWSCVCWMQCPCP